MDDQLSALLYYNISEKKFGELQKSLKEYRLLVSALLESILALENGDLEKFDSIVGENACQIRAIRIAIIFSSNCKNYQTFRDQIGLVLSKIDELLAPKNISVLMSSGKSFKQILEEYNLNIQLTSDEAFKLKSYLLTEMKEVISNDEFMSSLCRKSKCTPIRIKRINPDISYSFTTRLASHLRQKLSAASVNFIRDLANDLQDSYLVHMVSDDFKITHNALECIPMFWTYKILLKSAQKNRIPIVVQVKFLEKHQNGYRVNGEKFFFFSPSQNTYIEGTPSESDLEKAACVIQGVAYSDSSWDESLLVQSISHVILAGAADHRQYPDPNHLISIESAEYDYFKLLAKTQGFSADNPKTFFIQHVYPAQVKKVLNHQLQTLNLCYI